MSITRKDVEYIAYLSRIKIPAKQIEKFTEQLSGIIAYMDQLKKVDTKGVPPTSHPLLLKNIFRKDRVKKSLDPEEATGSAPQKENNFFKVPRVIEES